MAESADLETGEPEADSVEFGPLADSIGFLLRLAQLEAFRNFFAAFEKQDVRPGEVTVLILIGLNPGVRQGVLARSLMIKRAHMTKMARAMEAQGLVARRVPADDRRAIELTLTPLGDARVAALNGDFFAHEAGSNGRLSKRDAAEFKRLLRKFLDMN